MSSCEPKRHLQALRKRPSTAAESKIPYTANGSPGGSLIACNISEVGFQALPQIPRRQHVILHGLKYCDWKIWPFH